VLASFSSELGFNPWNSPWTKRQRPDRLERRIEFADYESTRLFLERLNELSEQHQRYPDIQLWAHLCESHPAR